MSTIRFEVRDAIAFVTIDRPDKLNALNAQVIDELGSAVDRIRSTTDIRAAILSGSGGKAFVAGADISELKGLSGLAAQQLSRRGSGIFRSIETSRKPYLAAIDGFALGGGCELAMACHLRLASETARFGQPEVKLGIPPGYGGTIRLARLAGRGRALELLTTGGMIDATEALRIGLVNRVVPSAQLLSEAEKLVRTILSNGPLAVAACLELATAQDSLPMDAALALESTTFGHLFETGDASEGISAFLDKRPPKFSGA
jgi:enoyl-CoA hydratase